MAVAWMVSDEVLFGVLRAWLATLPQTSHWNIDLYENDKVPEPGDSYYDYDLPTWSTYATRPVPLDQWTPAAVADHAAYTQQLYPASWTLDPPDDAATVYGYLVSDVYQNLLFAQRFDTPVVIPPGGGIQVVPVLYEQIQATC
jgi:hypothetical protein